MYWYFWITENTLRLANQTYRNQTVEPIVIHMRNLVRDAVIVITISIFLLVFIELSLRAFFPNKVKMPSQLAYVYDENTIVTLASNMEKSFDRTSKNGGYRVQWRSNSNSFRGVELQSDPVSRVIVYGDSNIQARFSGVERTFASQLSRALLEEDKSVEVINAGVVGFGPDQSLLRMTSEIDIYNPDAIVFHVFADNDYGDIIRNRLYEIDSNGKLVRTEYEVTQDMYLIDLERSRNSYQSFFSRLLVVRSLKKVVRAKKKIETPESVVGTGERVEQYISRARQEYQVYSKREPRSFSTFDDHYDIDVALFPNQKSSQDKKSLLNEILLEAKNVAYSRGVKFLVLIQPSVIDLTKANAYLSYEHLLNYAEYDPKNLTDPIMKSCSENDISCLNLYEVFKSNNPELMYFKDGDNHWSDLGQYVAAKETAKMLLTEQFIQ